MEGVCWEGLSDLCRSEGSSPRQRKGCHEMQSKQRLELMSRTWDPGELLKPLGIKTGHGAFVILYWPDIE